jgi:hypothetical protein
LAAPAAASLAADRKKKTLAGKAGKKKRLALGEKEKRGRFRKRQAAPAVFFFLTDW